MIVLTDAMKDLVTVTIILQALHTALYLFPARLFSNLNARSKKDLVPIARVIARTFRIIQNNYGNCTTTVKP